MITRVFGQGPDLLMLHGWGMNSGCWGDFADRLAIRYTVHLVDLPGHGPSVPKSEGASYDELVSRLLKRLPGAAWLGWSLGGQLALRAALQQPGAISHLVLISVNPVFVASANWPWAMDPALFRDFSMSLAQRPGDTLNRFLGLQVTGSEHARRTLKHLRETCLESPPGLAALQAGLEQLAQTGLAGRLGEIRTPALQIGGSADRLAPLEAQRQTTHGMANAKLFEIEGAGHAPFISHCEEVLDAVDRFLTRDKAA